MKKGASLWVLGLAFLLLSSLCSGCHHLSNNEDAVRVVPTTNNPHILPESAYQGGFPY